MNNREFIDLHVHIGPDIIPRKFDVDRLIKRETGKIKGIALKNHFYPTTTIISNKRTKILLVGSITLNNYVGGLNPDAIYACAKLSKRPIIVWFPTINSKKFLDENKYEIPEEWVNKNFKSRLSGKIKPVRILNKNGKLKKSTIEVLKTIKKNNCILATGHLSYKESERLVKEAIKIRIKKIIITHPIYQKINMPIKLQKKLSKYKGVYIEQSFTMNTIDKIPIEKIASQIKIVGAKKCIMTSDTGQLKSLYPSQAMNRFAKLLLKQGISKQEIEIMGIQNPGKILGLKETLINKQNLIKQKENKK